MKNLVLIAQESHTNELGISVGYGMVRFQRENSKGQTETLVYAPYLWDALRAKRKNNRQKQIIQQVFRRG